MDDCSVEFHRVEDPQQLPDLVDSRDVLRHRLSAQSRMASRPKASARLLVRQDQQLDPRWHILRAAAEVFIAGGCHLAHRKLIEAYFQLWQQRRASEDLFVTCVLRCFH